MITGVVAALRVEARTLGPPARRSPGIHTLRDGTLVAVSGMGLPLAGAAARGLVDAGVTALVSWGMAGGLDPRLLAGSLCLPNAVANGDGTTYPTDHHWRELLVAAIGTQRTVYGGILLTSAAALADPDAKAAAFRDSGALAVDMESTAIAAVATAARIPFIAVRSIVDTAADAVPAAVLGATGDGGVHLPRLLLGLMRRPADFGPLLRLAGRYGAAKRSLSAVARTGALAPIAFGAVASRHA